jgi:hypothetical protein
MISLEAVGAPARTALVIFTVAWILLFSCNPSFVQVVDAEEDIFPRAYAHPDPIKCLLVAIVVSVVSVTVWWGIFRDYRVHSSIGCETIEVADPSGSTRTMMSCSGLPLPNTAD